jgi:molybdopterin-binding protein
LDRLLRRRLTADFANILADTGVTVVYVTHDQDEALVVAQRTAVMNGGRIIACGPAEEVMGLAADEWSAGFLGLEPASAGVVAEVTEGLVSIRTGSITVYATGNPSVGTRVLHSVRPEDVLLFERAADLPPSTARNRIPATVVSVEPRGATLYVTMDAGDIRFAASVSRASAAEMGIEPGVSLLAVFKASAVRWRPDAADAVGDTL